MFKCFACKSKPKTTDKPKSESSENEEDSEEDFEENSTNLKKDIDLPHIDKLKNDKLKNDNLFKNDQAINLVNIPNTANLVKTPDLLISQRNKKIMNINLEPDIIEKTRDKSSDSNFSGLVVSDERNKNSVLKYPYVSDYLHMSYVNKSKVSFNFQQVYDLLLNKPKEQSSTLFKQLIFELLNSSKVIKCANVLINIDQLIDLSVHHEVSSKYNDVHTDRDGPVVEFVWDYLLTAKENNKSKKENNKSCTLDNKKNNKENNSKYNLQDNKYLVRVEFFKNPKTNIEEAFKVLRTKAKGHKIIFIGTTMHEIENSSLTDELLMCNIYDVKDMSLAVSKETKKRIKEITKNYFLNSK
jgi:hypothetical protein